MQRSVIDTARVEASRWGPPHVDEDWHAVCQAIHKGVEGAEWESLYDKFVEMNKRVNARHLSGSGRARTLWKVRDAKERGDDSSCISGSGSAGIVEQTVAESSIGLG